MRDTFQMANQEEDQQKVHKYLPQLYFLFLILLFLFAILFVARNNLRLKD